MNIDLTDYIANLRLLEGRIEDAETEMNAARSNLAERQKSTKKQLTTLLNQGETTGNPLQDSLIRLYGLEEERIRKILAWNEMLKEKKGHYFLLAGSYKHCIKHVMFDTPGNHNEYESLWRLLFGKLNGEGLTIELNENKEPSELFIPVSPYIISKNGELERKLECLKLSGESYFSFQGEVGMREFLENILTPQNDLRIHIGDENDEKLKNAWHYGFDFEEFKKLLESPTPTELIAGENI